MALRDHAWHESSAVSLAHMCTLYGELLRACCRSRPTAAPTFWPPNFRDIFEMVAILERPETVRAAAEAVAAVGGKYDPSSDQELKGRMDRVRQQLQSDPELTRARAAPLFAAYDRSLQIWREVMRRKR